MIVEFRLPQTRMSFRAPLKSRSLFEIGSELERVARFRGAFDKDVQVVRHYAPGMGEREVGLRAIERAAENPIGGLWA